MAKKKDQNFEENMRKLEEVVESLEKGGLQLDESMKLFKEGTELFVSCNKILDDAQTQLDVLFEEKGEYLSRNIFADGSGRQRTYVFEEDE